MPDRPSFGDPKTDLLFKRIFGHEQTAPPRSRTLELARVAALARTAPEPPGRELIVRQVRQGLLSYAWKKVSKRTSRKE